MSWWPPIGKIAAHSAYEMFSWYKYLIVSLVFSHLGFWSGSLFLIAPFPDLCLLVLLLQSLHYSDQEKQNADLPLGIQYLDRGNLLIVKKPFFDFVKVIIKHVCGNVNMASYQHLGTKMTHLLMNTSNETNLLKIALHN